MSARFLVTTPIPDPGLPLLRGAGAVTVLPQPPDSARLRELCASGDYDVVPTQLQDTVDASLLAEAKVRGVSDFAVGHNNIDVAAATRHGILVGNTPGVLTDATADVAMALVLATAHRAVEGDRMVREGRFTGWEPGLLLGRDVTGGTPGLAGFGRIARTTARRALAFGMTVLFAPRPPAHRIVGEEELGEFAGRVTQVRWEERVARSDHLSLHVPLTDRTRHLVDADVLARMSPGAILINTAPGRTEAAHRGPGRHRRSTRRRVVQCGRAGTARDDAGNRAPRTAQSTEDASCAQTSTPARCRRGTSTGC